MLSIGTTLLMMALAVAAAFACVVMVVAATQFTAGRRHGYFHLVIPLILLIAGLTVALSNRSVDLNATALAAEGMVKHPIAAWAQRIGTILMLTVAAERIISHFGRGRSLLGAAPLLALCYIGFWLGSVASPMFFSAYPAFAHDAVYTLVIGLAALLLRAEEAETALLAARNALLLFLLGGYLLLPLHSDLVLDVHYTQGLIPGLPRMAGLAPHAVTEGMLAQLALLCLWARPFAGRRLNLAAWGLGLLTLLLAQSKTAWISFLCCAVAMFVCQHGGTLKARLFDPERPHSAVGALLALLLLCGGLMLAALFGDMGDKLHHFLGSSSGEQLTSLTGRDLIWAAAYEEWLRHPLFGYGPHFLDASYRIAIGLPNATHGHNQYMDVLPRSGLAGAIPLTFYLIALLWLSIRHARASRGLSLALFIALGLRAVSEVPLTLEGYGPEFSGHLLLLILLPAYSALAQRQAAAATAIDAAVENTAAAPAERAPTFARTSPQA